MGMGKNSMNAVELTDRGGQVILLDAKIKGKRFSIEDVHDSKWIYEIAYRHDGVDYSGETSQYIHWAPRFVMQFFNGLYEEGGEVRIRVDAANPSAYDANMDYAIAMSLGAGYVGSDEGYEVEVVDVDGIPGCAELRVKGHFGDESHFTKTLFRLLASGYDKFIFNLVEMEGNMLAMNGAISWAQRYIMAFTSGKEVAVLKRKGFEGFYPDLCRIISDDREDIIAKFTSGYLTPEEKLAEEYSKLSPEEKEEYQRQQFRPYFEKFKDEDGFADHMMSLGASRYLDQGSLAEVRKFLEGKDTLSEEEEEIKKELDRLESLDLEEMKRHLREEYKKQWREAMRP